MEYKKSKSKGLKPKYVATVGEGYVQSRQCEYYYGVSERVDFGKGASAGVLLVNPKDSGVVIYLNKLSCANYANSPISVDVYTKAGIDGELEKSPNIAAGNTGCKCSKSKGRIYYGEELEVTDGTLVYSRSIEPFRTSDGYPNGSIILQPGTSRLYIMKTINPLETSIGSLSFAWWEDKIHDEHL